MDRRSQVWYKLRTGEGKIVPMHVNFARVWNQEYLFPLHIAVRREELSSRGSMHQIYGLLGCYRATAHNELL